MPDRAGAAHATGRWRATAGLIWTQYDDGDDWAVYNPASSNIHLLTASAYCLWTLVSSESPSLSLDLAAKLAAALGRPLDDELMTVTREALAFMDQAGLVAPVWT